MLIGLPITTNGKPVYLNTSHVNVNLAKDVVLIHDVEHLNTSHVNVNLCGSYWSSIRNNLNTSHVNVNLYKHLNFPPLKIHLNTSHVNVNLSSP